MTHILGNVKKLNQVIFEDLSLHYYGYFGTNFGNKFTCGLEILVELLVSLWLDFEFYYLS